MRRGRKVTTLYDIYMLNPNARRRPRGIFDVIGHIPPLDMLDDDDADMGPEAIEIPLPMVIVVTIFIVVAYYAMGEPAAIFVALTFNLLMIVAVLAHMVWRTCT
jgi:hypothetical protein